MVWQRNRSARFDHQPTRYARRVHRAGGKPLQHDHGRQRRWRGVQLTPRPEALSPPRPWGRVAGNRALAASHGVPARSAAAQDAEVVAGDVDQISFVVRRFACLPTPGRRRSGFPLNEVSKPVYVIDREGLCSRRGPSRPLTKSGAAIQMSNGRAWRGMMARHNRSSGSMADPAASAVLAAFDAAQDAGLRSVDCYRAGGRGVAPTPIPTRPPRTLAARRSR
jgi:hypothetical protein